MLSFSYTNTKDPRQIERRKKEKKTRRKQNTHKQANKNKGEEKRKEEEEKKEKKTNKICQDRCSDDVLIIVNSQEGPS